MQSFKLLNEFSLVNSSSEQLQEFLSNKQCQYTVKKIGQSIHIRSTEKGFEVQYQMKKGKNKYEVASVFLYINNKKSKPYPEDYSLSYKLHSNTPIKGAVMILGEPTSKSKFTTECSWKHLGIDIVYVGLSWTDQNLKMDYICLYHPQVKNSQVLCSVCHRSIDKREKYFGCQLCKGVVNYCGEVCKEKHFRLHQMYCQEIDEE